MDYPWQIDPQETVKVMIWKKTHWIVASELSQQQTGMFDTPKAFC